MLRFYGDADRFCDRISRRSFVQAGVLGLSSLTLPQLLAAPCLRRLRGPQDICHLRRVGRRSDTV